MKKNNHSINSVNIRRARFFNVLFLWLISWGCFVPASQASEVVWQKFVKQATRPMFEQSLDKVRTEVYLKVIPYIQDKYKTSKAPTIFISYAWEEEVKQWVDEELSKDLSKLGFEVLYDQKNILPATDIKEFEKGIEQATYVVVVCTPKYKKKHTKYPTRDSGVGREMQKITARLKDINLKGTVFPIYRGGSLDQCVPDALRDFNALDVGNIHKYYATILKLSQPLFLFETNDAEPINMIREEFMRQQGQLVKRMTGYLRRAQQSVKHSRF